MNVWRLTAAKNLVHETEEIVPDESKRKIRVTKVFVDGDDALIFGGTHRVAYPRIPGRFAVGVIVDDKKGHDRKDARVLLHMHIPEPDCGTQKPDYTIPGQLICGDTADGFLRDFVFLDEDAVTLLPESVSDNDALLLEYLALAKAAVDALELKKGAHIAVIGGDMLGIFICQLLIYQQVSPILIDSRPDRLQFAHDCGIYYTTLPDKSLPDNIGSLTGGWLADGVIYTTGTRSQAPSPFTLCSRGQSVVFCGQNSDRLLLDLNAALMRQLTIYTISDGTDYMKAAINLVAQQAIDLSNFRGNKIAADALPALFRDMLEKPDRPVNEMNVIDLL